MAENTTRISQLLHHLFSTFPEHHQFNAAFISVKFYISCFFRRGFVDIFPHAPFAFLIASVLQFLQLKYQGKDKTPLDTHPITTNNGIASLLIYCLSYSTEQRFSSILHDQMRAREYIRYCKNLASSVSLASTASILFMDSTSPVLFVIFFMLSAAELLYRIYGRAVQEIRELHNGRRTTPTQQIFIILRRLVDRFLAQPRPILPLTHDMARED